MAVSPGIRILSSHADISHSSAVLTGTTLQAEPFLTVHELCPSPFRSKKAIKEALLAR